MLFQQGDHVVYPGYGAGTIIAIENREFTGTTTRYYMLKMVAKEGEFMVPIDSADSLGIRRVVEREAIWAVLGASAGDLPGDYKERQAGISQLLSTSHALSMSQGSRDLARFAGFRSLTGRDVQLYEELQTLLASELVLIEGISLEDARDRLAQTLAAITEAAALEKAELDRLEQEKADQEAAAEILAGSTAA
jgi:CarD family transcriptional regulator